MKKRDLELERELSKRVRKVVDFANDQLKEFLECRDNEISSNDYPTFACAYYHQIFENSASMIGSFIAFDQSPTSEKKALSMLQESLDRVFCEGLREYDKFNKMYEEKNREKQ